MFDRAAEPEDGLGAEALPEPDWDRLAARARQDDRGRAAALLDPRDPLDAVELAIVRAEFASRSANLASAERLVAVSETVALAEAHPELSLDGLSPDRAEDVRFAVRAAVADLAVRLAESEATVRRWVHEADVLRARMPRLWGAFLDGDVSYANARIAAETVTALPTATPPAATPPAATPPAEGTSEAGATGEGAPAPADPASEVDGADYPARGALDTRLTELAVALTPARFRQRARAARERLHPEPATARQARAAVDRRVFVEAADDGMAWLTLFLPAAEAWAAFARVDGDARELRDVPGEGRTLAQLRADVATDLLTAEQPGAPDRRARVAVTVPVLTLLGVSDEPGTLDGYGPIDADTARRLAAGAPSFTRILTHPVSGTVLDVDRTSYRVPADLRRRIGVRDGTCGFPGCGRAADGCDLDHVREWADGGTTCADNLHPLCRHHHRLKHRTGWAARRPAPGGPVRWTSPTGHVSAPVPVDGIASTTVPPPGGASGRDGPGDGAPVDPPF